MTPLSIDDDLVENFSNVRPPVQVAKRGVRLESFLEDERIFGTLLCRIFIALLGMIFNALLGLVFDS